MATVSHLHAPSFKVIKSDFSARTCCWSKICSCSFSVVWENFSQLLLTRILLKSGFPCVSSSLAQPWHSNVCCIQVTIHCSMLKDAPANVRLEFLMVPILASQPVDAKQVQEALRAAPQVVKVVTQPPPKSQLIKPPYALASAKSQSASQQTSSQAGSFLGEREAFNFHVERVFWEVIVLSGQQSQKPEASSSHISFSLCSFYKSV